jgi:hypothetical protein
MDAPWPKRSPYSFNLDRLWYSARSPMYLRNKIVALVRVIVFHNTTKQYQTIPNNTKQYQTIPNNTKEYQRIPNNVPPPVLVTAQESGEVGLTQGYPDKQVRRG